MNFINSILLPKSLTNIVTGLVNDIGSVDSRHFLEYVTNFVIVVVVILSNVVLVYP